MYSSNKRKVQKTLSGRSGMIAKPKVKATKKIKGSVKPSLTNFNATTLEDLLKKIGEFKQSDPKKSEEEKKLQGEGVVDIIEKGVKKGTSLANKANAVNKIAKRFGIESGAQPYIDKFGNALDVGHHLLDAGKSLKKVIGKGVEKDIEKQILSLGKGTPQEGTGIIDYIIKFLLLFLEPDDPEQEEFKEEPRREEPRREEPKPEPEPETPPEDKSKNCVSFLKSMGIKTKRDFNKWGLRGGHPDKGGETLLFQQVSNCVDKIIKGKGMTGGSSNKKADDPMDIDEEPRRAEPRQPIQPRQPQNEPQNEPLSAAELLRRLNERTQRLRRIQGLRAGQQGEGNSGSSRNRVEPLHDWYYTSTGNLIDLNERADGLLTNEEFALEKKNGIKKPYLVNELRKGYRHLGRREVIEYIGRHGMKTDAQLRKLNR